MRTRRSLFGALAGALVAGQSRPVAGLLQEDQEIDLDDPALAGLLDRLRKAKPSEKTPLLQDLVEELVHRQEVLTLEVRALETRASYCSCPEDALENKGGAEECLKRTDAGRSALDRVFRQTTEKPWKPLSRSPSGSGRKAPRGGSAGRPGSRPSSALSPS